ncbi:MAG: TRAP transporter large permease subunit, partial [Brachybacterium sp.]|nr:TRAP transporter large permease subunit [Brachybacterium sp.]
MDPAMLAGLILIVGIIVLIAIGAPIAVAIGAPSALALIAVIGPEPSSYVAAQRMFMGANSFTLLAIPFFVLAGQLMNTGGVATRLIDAAKVLVGRLPGSLAQTNVIANGLFGSISGAAVASAAAVGGVLGPRQRREGYEPAFASAVNVASAPSGMLLPPSNTLIVYSLVSGTSVAALFAAGYGPGLLWVGGCLVMVMLLATWKPALIGGAGQQDTERLSVGVAALTLLRALPAVLMIVVVIGGLLAGYFTATESAVIAVVYSLVLGFAYRQLALSKLPAVILAASRTTAVVLFLIAVS